MLTCTICGQPADFARLKLEIAQGTATYLLCLRPLCIHEAMARASDNLLRASAKVRAQPGFGAIDAKSVEP